MNLKEIVEQALQLGYLTPAMSAEIGQFIDHVNVSKLSTKEYMALDRLMGALLTGEILTS